MPGTAAPIPIEFLDVAGSTCGALLPTGHAIDTVDGIEVTCIDNGMPVVVHARRGPRRDRRRDARRSSRRTPALKARIERIRLAVGPLMNLGDVTTQDRAEDVPGQRRRGTAAPIDTRTFIPHRVHEAIGVLGAVSVATACVMPGLGGRRGGAASQRRTARSASRSSIRPASSPSTMDVERRRQTVVVRRAALLRTARKLMRGEVFVPGAVWSSA